MSERHTPEPPGNGHKPSSLVPDLEKMEEGDLAEIRQYVQEDYWEHGKAKGLSGYDGAYINWWWVNRWMQCFAQVFPVRDKVILDLGCGYGSVVAGFQTWGADAYGIDISDYAVEKGKNLADYLAERLYQGSVHDLSRWGDETFDIIYSNQVFEHVPERYVTDVIAEAFRVLKPGGLCWFAFVTSTEENGVRGENDQDQSHINIHNMDWWRRRFFQAGFGERKDLDDALRNATTGYDHFSYFQEYGWDSIALEKPGDGGVSTDSRVTQIDPRKG
ncbi:MAG: class I SAM-dependent methyltransferase [Phycisphaerales bacterium]|nr:MAG: class I SAM-dependent methyltransferase [Phycisphaerales bacterium]